MSASKASSASKFFSNKNEPQTVRATSTKAINFDTLSTEGQQERIKKLIQEVRKGGITSPNAITISQSELLRIKSSAAIVSQEERLHQKRILEEQTEKQQSAAKAKKQKMMEIEAERRKNIPPTEGEMEATMKNESVQARAMLLLNEEMDDVKQMNQMMLYAKVVTIRDKQLAEKQQIGNHLKVEEKRKDLIMEIERLKKIKYFEDLDKVRREEQRKAALEAVEQIKERELERLKAQEDREREGQEMLKHIKQLEKEESHVAMAKKRQQKDLLDQIFDSNQKAISKKHEKVLEEQAEDERIHQYNIEKAQKEAEYQAELKRIKDEKEREVQKLRELQEKANDRQADIDSLRAKRATELADRLAREKERREAELKAKINQEVLAARKLQSLEKERRLQDQARQEREEFQKIVHSQKAERGMELEREQEKSTKFKDHSDQLKKQIAMSEEKKKQGRREFLEEGKMVRDKLHGEKQVLEAIKQQKLEELISIGIEPKYAAELAKKKIAI